MRCVCNPIEKKKALKFNTKQKLPEKILVLETIIRSVMGEDNFNKWKRQGGVSGEPKGVAEIQRQIKKQVKNIYDLAQLRNDEADSVLASIAKIARDHQNKTSDTMQAVFYKAILQAYTALEQFTSNEESRKEAISKACDLIKNPKPLLSEEKFTLDVIRETVKNQKLWINQGWGMFGNKEPSGVVEMRKKFNDKSFTDWELWSFVKKLSEEKIKEFGNPEEAITVQDTFYFAIWKAAEIIRLNFEDIWVEDKQAKFDSQIKIIQDPEASLEYFKASSLKMINDHSKFWTEKPNEISLEDTCRKEVLEAKNQHEVMIALNRLRISGTALGTEAPKKFIDHYEKLKLVVEDPKRVPPVLPEKEAKQKPPSPS